MLLLTTFAGSIDAHNKVVVIPLGAQEPTLNPPSPVAQPSPSPLSYVAGPLTLNDIVTGLQWQRNDIGGSTDRVNWADAADYCDDLVLGGHNDWRVPNIKELQSIVDFQASSPSINQLAFPGTDFPTSYWSSTTITGAPLIAWGIDFTSGRATASLKIVGNYVRCVR